MAKTIFITGASTGIGRATAKLFSEKGWNVAATMRHPENETELGNLPGVKLYTLDVTDLASIESARDQAIADFGGVDVVHNNAGYAVTGYFEDMTEDQIRRQYEVNVFGLMRVTKAFLPHFRTKKDGVFVNMSSIGGVASFPGVFMYNSTKFAVEGFSEGVSYELSQLGIRTILIQPGNIKTDFQGRSQERVPSTISDYDAIAEKQRKASEGGSTFEFLDPSAVADLIYSALQDNSGRVRYWTDDVDGMVELRKNLGPDGFMQVMKKNFFGE